MNREFDSAPLVAGTVRGVRSFDVDHDGMLIGPRMGSIWQPGENQATCLWPVQILKALDNPPRFIPGLLIIGGVMCHWDAKNQQWTVHDSRKNHSMARCQCGFYAYHDGSDDYRADATVSAVVEGYGDVMLGTRGFRAEKARILAICLQSAQPDPEPKAPSLVALALNGALLWIAQQILTALTPRTSSPDLTSTSPIAGTEQDDEDDFEPLDSARAALVRKQYPDVPVFTSFEDMVTAFPPHAGRTADEQRGAA